MYNQWLTERVHQFTEDENMKPSFRKIIIEWVLDPWSQLSKENIKSLKCCDFNLANDSTEDEKETALRSWMTKAELSAIIF